MNPKKLAKNMVPVSGVDKVINLSNRARKFLTRPEVSAIAGSGITLTKNDIKDAIKVIGSLENGGMSLKGTNGKVMNY